MTNNIDLHIHSTASDGTFTPSEIAVLASKAGLKAAALTDHDTTAGVTEFKKECEKTGVEPVSGIELSAKFRCEMHILGLFVDIEDKAFAEKVQKLANSRADRNIAMLEKIQKNGIDITEEDILSQKEGATLNNTGRAHMAIAMVKKGYVKDTNEAFSKYLGKDKPLYVPRLSYTPKECIEMIKSAGGLAILAHPIFITRDETELYELLKTLKACGLDGVESIYSAYDEKFSALCLNLCGQLSLLPTGGSDFHGENRPDVKLGDLKAPYELLEKLKERIG